VLGACQNFKETSFIILDSVSHYNVLLEKLPALSWRREKIIVWVQEERILFPAGFFRVELLNLITPNKSSTRR
jgi:hypothetical protein